MSNTSTFIIIDSQPVLRRGLASLLIDSFAPDQVIEAKNITEYIQSEATTMPDLVILGVRDDKQENEFDTVDILKTKYPQTAIITYSQNFKAALTIRYLKAGASAYFSKDWPWEELVQCVVTVLKGNRYLSAENWDDFFKFLPKGSVPRAIIKQQNLTPRQQQIAVLISKGAKTSRIAKKLGLHTSTVSTVKATIYKKLGVSNIVELREQIG